MLVQPDTSPAGVDAIRVLLADDHALVRHGIGAVLREAGGFTVLGEAENGRDAVRLAARLSPDIVLLDVEMPGLSVLETLRQIRRTCPQTRVLLLGTRAAEDLLFQFLSAGAAGLLLKEGTAAELLGALRDVQRSDFYVSSAVSRKVLDRWHRGLRPLRRRSVESSVTRPAANAAGVVAGTGATGGLDGTRDAVVGRSLSAVSERERQVLDLISAGYSNREVAERLCISVKTVEAHKAHMIERLGLRGASDLLRYAVHQAVQA